MVIDIRLMRNKDIIDAYFDCMKEVRLNSPYVSKEVVIDELMKRKAPRFYVSYRTAQIVISQMEKGKKVSLHNSNRIEMYSELFRRFLEKKNRNMGYRILEDIINEEAPSFYVDRHTMNDIVYKALRSRKCHSF